MEVAGVRRGAFEITPPSPTRHDASIRCARGDSLYSECAPRERCSATTAYSTSLPVKFANIASHADERACSAIDFKPRGIPQFHL